MTIRLPAYHKYPDMPVIGHVVRVWWHTVEIDAVWDGHAWRSVEGQRLQGPITHWRER